MNKYVKLYGLFMGTVLFACLVWSILVYVQIGVPTESSRWIYEVINKKHIYASQIKESKILIVSGSNSLFGVSAKTIEHEMKVPTVNMAVSAGLQLEYILEQTKSVARQGDIIVLPLEYSLYDYDGKPDKVLIDYVFSRDFAYMQKKNIFEKARFVFGIDIVRLLKGIKNRYLVADSYSDEGYQSWSINANGDEMNNRHEHSPTREEISRYIPLAQLMRGIGKDTKSWAILDEFINWCRQNNITLLVGYPSILRNDAYSSPKTKKTINQINDFWETKGIKILGKCDEFVYEPEYLYDTAYHLNDLGRIKRTMLLINYLKMWQSDKLETTEKTN